MNNYFENKITYNQITFHLTDKATVDEREIHPYHEILLYIDGNAQLLTAEGRHSLKNLSIIIIPEDTYHFLHTEKKPEFTRLKISFPPNILTDTPLAEIMTKLRLIENFSEGMSFIFNKLYHILKENTKEAPFYAYSAFLMLISELNIASPPDAQRFHMKQNPVMSSLTDYISENLSSSLDINSLSKIMHISHSGITHLFKKEFGISIHKYILQKRLIYAKRLINEGKQPTKIYADVGFKDYSTFYKAYINYFGYSPSKENDKNARLS